MRTLTVPLTFLPDGLDPVPDGAGVNWYAVQTVSPATGHPKVAVVYCERAPGVLAEVLRVDAMIGTPHIVTTATGAYLCGGGRNNTIVTEVSIPGFVSRDRVQTLDLTAPWTGYGPPFAPPTLHMVGGLVTLQGVLRGTGTNALEVPLCVLPVGCRPDTRLAFPVAVGLNFALAAGRVDVLPTGEVLIGNVNVNWVSLAGINFGVGS